jgi:hypothetical protein
MRIAVKDRSVTNLLPPISLDKTPKCSEWDSERNKINPKFRKVLMPNKSTPSLSTKRFGSHNLDMLHDLDKSAEIPKQDESSFMQHGPKLRFASKFLKPNNGDLNVTNTVSGSYEFNQQPTNRIEELFESY